MSSTQPREVVLSIQSVHTTCSGTVSVNSERSDTRNDIRITQKVGTPRVTQTGTASGVVVAQKQRKVTSKTRGIDLNKGGVRHHSDSLCFNKDWVDLLKSVSNRGEFTMLLQSIKLAQLWKHTIRDRILHGFGETSVAFAFAFLVEVVQDNNANIVDKKCTWIEKRVFVKRIGRDFSGVWIAVSRDSTLHVRIKPDLS
jgi:hypothetical protein